MFPVDNLDNLDNLDNRVVPRFSGSKENIWKNVGEGVIQSIDVTPDFKLDLKPMTPYGRQELPFPRASKPNIRPPLGPRLDNRATPAVQLDISALVLGVEVAAQEREAAERLAELEHIKRERDLLRKILGGFMDLHVIYHEKGLI